MDEERSSKNLIFWIIVSVLIAILPWIVLASE